MDAAFSVKDQVATVPKRSSYFCGSPKSGKIGYAGAALWIVTLLGT
jgi:hypothetical protein